ncbi:MAG TPA: type II secretion system F family protein [Dermatophilaceae bacterium]|nr:type II secretion system F family protein [Dermatophilaceae bacterium]
MKPLAIGLLFGMGLFCIYWSWWPASPSWTRPGRVSFRDRIRDEIAQAGLEGIAPRHVLLASGIAFVLVLAGVFSATKVLPVSLCFAGIAGYAPRALVAMRARQRRTQLRDVWPDAVDNLASGVRAGLALPEALAQLAVRGPEELRPAFATFAEDYRSSGSFQECLDRLKHRLADPVGDRLVESLRIAREVGGSDLGRVLRTLSSFLREDARTRAELETRQGWTINAARLASAAPWIVLGMMSFQPNSLTAYATPAGAAVLAVGAAVTVVAYRLMVRIGRLPDDQRVLR